jgi:hypothetical protein
VNRLKKTQCIENGVVKIQSGLEGRLTAGECDAVKVYLTPNRDVVAVDSGDVVDLSFADSLLHDGRDIRRRRIAASMYCCTEHVTSTSNACERLFCAARLIVNHLSGHMDPDSCEMLLFLKINSRFWENPQILDTIIANEKKLVIDGIHVDGDDDEFV